MGSWPLPTERRVTWKAPSGMSCCCANDAGGERYSAVRFRYGIVGAPPSSASAARGPSSRISSTLQRRTSGPRHAPQRSTASGFANTRSCSEPAFPCKTLGPSLTAAQSYSTPGPKVVACRVRSLILMWSIDLEPGSVRGESQKCKDVPSLRQTLHGSDSP